jgi:opacity protein-like surface antigen
MRPRVLTVPFLFLLFLCPAVVLAQSGAIANVGVGVAAADGESDLAINGGIGYRFNRSIGFGIELTHMPSLESDLSRGFGASTRLVFGNDDAEGHATIFTTNVRIEIPTTMRRVIPFVIGGGGVASVTGPYPIYYALPLASSVISALPPSLSTTIATLVPQILPGPQFVSNTTIAMALTLGGGASVLITDHLAVDVDLRAMRLLGETDRGIGRFGVGASYRF